MNISGLQDMCLDEFLERISQLRTAEAEAEFAGEIRWVLKEILYFFLILNFVKYIV